DRLINELEVTPEQMQERFIKIIKGVNDLIMKMVPPEFKKEWGVKVDDGSVAFGSAYHNWAISVPYMKEFNISFKEIYDYCAKDEQKALSKKAPIHQILLDMVIEHLPNPVQAQIIRIPNIWHGDIESKVGQSMMKCSKDGPVALMVTKIIIDPHAGEIAIGRMFSGSIKRGQTLHILGMPNPNRVQQVSLCVGSDRIAVEEIDAGNIVAINGLKDAIAGSTVSDDPEMDAFEKIVHYSEPVVTVAIEAKHMRDLPKLVEVLRSVAKADPSIHVEINQETGEHLMSGMGELHLEITEYRIINEYGVEIQSSPPIVVYRESIEKAVERPFEGKSPNKHNRFYMQVSPLEEGIVKAIREGTLQVEGKIKDGKAMAAQLQELGLTKDEAKKIVVFEGPNVLIDGTKGIQYLHETMELCKEAFKEAINRGPLAEEKVVGMKVKLMDAKLHEDTIHRGPAQVIPAVRQAIYGAMCQAGRILMEPKQMVYVSVPQDVMGGATGEMQQRRAVIEDMTQDGDMTTIKAKAPVAEMFGFSNDMRSVTGGRAMWSTENSGFERVPRELQADVVSKIRTRKGLKPEPYDEHYYSSIIA
ncbi:MAG: elongation factor EF-2, partial [Thermoplasmata archaeon]|nr:elongation factor EF-2 [Thermoplasmata archaeon]